jgi:hypothetical protein
MEVGSTLLSDVTLCILAAEIFRIMFSWVATSCSAIGECFHFQPED